MQSDQDTFGNYVAVSGRCCDPMPVVGPPPCTPPAVPVLSVGSSNGGTVRLNWAEAADPPLDFLLQWGNTPGGPYPSSASKLASLRTDLSNGRFDPSASWYITIVARATLGCVSANSNEVNIPVAG